MAEVADAPSGRLRVRVPPERTHHRPSTVGPLAIATAEQARAQNGSRFPFKEVSAGSDERHYVPDGYDADGRKALTQKRASAMRMGFYKNTRYGC